MYGNLLNAPRRSAIEVRIRLQRGFSPALNWLGWVEFYGYLFIIHKYEMVSKHILYITF